jgi:2,3-bisphosphoglycerate-independent phosphoglycerate mutase
MKKTILIIRDGWGYREEKEDNAIARVPTPFTDKLMQQYPNVLINASGKAAGLPEGYQGNSEVGHMTIGSGRIIFQSLQRINKTIEDKSFFENKRFLEAIENCKKNNTKLHIIGLMQTEGVHSHLDHLFALVDLCKQQDFKDVYYHVITDGRDAPVTKSLEYLEKLQEKIKETEVGEIATISGRYYAMDRDKRWDRTKKAYECIALAQTQEEFTDAKTSIEKSHKEKVTDEFIIPRKQKNYQGIKENDSIIFYNFRTDRPRQLTKAIVEEEFDGWERKPLNVFYVGMTQFYTPMNAKVAFEDQKPENLLGEVVSRAGLKQLRISETEKYAHVTFFFNGQKEKPNEGEDRILIHSPKVATYDLKPEMSVFEIADQLVEKINEDKYHLIVCNLVNGDMVGHTGVIEAIEKAVEAVDKALEKIVTAGLEKDYNLLVFADHGNAEDQTPQWRTSHTTNPVPFIVVSNDKELKNIKLKEGMGLSNIAPTALKIMGLQKPEEMVEEMF